MKKNITALAIFSVTLMNAQENCKDLRINQIQVLGTHNSYAQPVDKKVLNLAVPIISKLMQNFTNHMSEEQKAKMVENHPNGIDFNESLNYDHPNFEEQLNAKIRSLEIDIYHDPTGNRFIKPAAYEALKQKGDYNLAHHNINGLDQPGFKVLHMSDIDFRSHYPTLKNALQAFKKWSNENPNHSVIYIMIEANPI